jgi:hypothetical protein
MIEMEMQENSILKELGNNERRSCFERFLLKKYKCIIIWLISIISITELIYLLLEKSSDSVINDILNKYLNNTFNFENKKIV